MRLVRLRMTSEAERLTGDLAVPGGALAAVEVAAAVALGAAVHLPGVAALNMHQVTFNIIKNLCQSVQERFCIRQINLVLNIEEGHRIVC